MSTRDKDFFGFGTGEVAGEFGLGTGGASAVPSEIAAADDRTLRLAAPGVNAEKVEAFLAYQRAFVTRTELSLADGHLAALQASGLDGNAQAQLNTVAQAFCGRRITSRRLRERLPSLEGEVADNARKELARLEDLTELSRRYGADAIACLQAREEALIEAHQAVLRRVREA